ncbi:ParM/StbA family protein [Bacillus safensis]|uniref:Uncharacterized protein n=1 Tax=Bacillus safensis TaxID=561879 RepID=A0A1L6ZPC3_BACIA|nr:ParM/StbA family protein [Bacillus safensis]APT48374.1 hypothetical protein BSA145_21160 [Bacillus safensis]
MTKFINFAVDLGNGFVKAKSEHRTVVAPSVIAKEQDVSKSSIASYQDEETTYRTFDSHLRKGVNYIWGEGIKNAVKSPDKLLPTYTFQDRYKSDLYKLLVEFVLGELALDYDDTVNVRVVTGMPSDELEQQDKEDLEQAFEGSHVVKVNGQEKVIKVEKITILEQPMGSLFYVMINEKLEMSKDFTKRVVFYDFGAGTTIMDVFENGKRDDDESITQPLGMNDVYKEVRKMVQRKFSLKKLTTHQIEDAFRKDFNIKVGSKMFNCEEEAKIAVSDFLERVMSTFQGVLNSRDYIDKIYITGGGTNIVKDEVKKYFSETEEVHFVENSQTASVEGFYKFAEVMNTWED